VKGSPQNLTHCCANPAARKCFSSAGGKEQKKGRKMCPFAAGMPMTISRRDKIMAFKVHKVQKYNYSFDARSGGPGQLQLWGETKKIADISFVDDNVVVPAPTFTPDLESAKVYFKRSALYSLIDMLRNEAPVSVTINNQPPGFVFVHTGLEPAGEGEA
jgi:hypothetical protein